MTIRHPYHPLIIISLLSYPHPIFSTCHPPLSHSILQFQLLFSSPLLLSVYSPTCSINIFIWVMLLCSFQSSAEGPCTRLKRSEYLLFILLSNITTLLYSINVFIVLSLVDVSILYTSHVGTYKSQWIYILLFKNDFSQLYTESL